VDTRRRAVDGGGRRRAGGYAHGRRRLPGAPWTTGPTTRRPTTPGSRAGRALAVLLLAAGLLAGCGRLLGGDGGTGRAPAGLATSEAERASWPEPPGDAVRAMVQRVTDGDTFVATVGGHRERVRVIGVDTPETVAPNRPVEPYGREASDFAKRFLTDATVRLAGDVEARDRFGRVLAYVWLADGTFWNALLVAEGYAQQLTIPPNVAYAPLLRRLAAQARGQDRGLWTRKRPGG
jgi:endonuclease YncB( thermonuclease family)